MHKDRVFGPAFNRAYLIESSLARYPRIIIEDRLCSYGLKNPVTENINYFDWMSVSSEIYDYLERGDDGQWAINYLPHLYEASHDVGIQNIDVLIAHRDHLKKLLSDAKAKGVNEPALAKIRWVASYHNRVIRKYFPTLLNKFEDKDDSLIVSLD